MTNPHDGAIIDAMCIPIPQKVSSTPPTTNIKTNGNVSCATSSPNVPPILSSLCDTLSLEDELTLSGSYYIVYTLDGSEPVNWITSASGTLSPTAKTFSNGNILQDLKGQQGWVNIRVICKSTKGWSPIADRRFYILDTSGLEAIPDMAKQGTPDFIYDISGRRIPAPPQRGIYIHNGRKIWH